MKSRPRRCAFAAIIPSPCPQCGLRIGSGLDRPRTLSTSSPTEKVANSPDLRFWKVANIRSSVGSRWGAATRLLAMDVHARSIALQISGPDGQRWSMAMNHAPILPIAPPEALVGLQQGNLPDPATA